ncbi:hypoxanthine phosphoribosyltransferase [Negadavirga shengliensis]|uniref:Hypoxanthine phosphoribosyltransferase n=1 Tax=Negadavirga shengliensis TaxID=1389218 RepID=A0ABV9SXW7_9BACT
MVKIKDRRFEPYIHESKVLERVSLLAKNIERDYRGKEPLLLAVLNGSFMFISDLAKSINIPIEVSFIKISSYQATRSSGEIKKLVGLDRVLKGRDVIIVEDIVDTGKSMAYILEMVQEQEPASVEIASLLLKPASLEQQIKIKYLGFEIPDAFVVGYGLDYDGLGRNLNHIYQLKS